MRMKLPTILALALLIMSGTTFSAEHTIDTAHSSFNFKIKHMFSKTMGKFNKFNGDIEFYPKNIKKSKFNIQIDPTSIDTDNQKRDKHLRSDDFFHVEKYDKITFKSKEIKVKGDKKFDVKGDLTIKGVTKLITVNMVYLGQNKDPWGNLKAGFEASTKLNRKDFNITWNKTLDSGGFLLGDMVEIEVFLETENKSKTKS
jgi:polyisoprenoid-binding protein YceI